MVSSSGFEKYGNALEVLGFAEEQFALVITEECHRNMYLEMCREE